MRIESGESAPRERRVIGRNLGGSEDRVGVVPDGVGLRAVVQGHRPGIRGPILRDDLPSGGDLEESSVLPLADEGVPVFAPLRARDDLRMERTLILILVLPDGLGRTEGAALGNEVATVRLFDMYNVIRYNRARRIARDRGDPFFSQSGNRGYLQSKGHQGRPENVSGSSLAGSSTEAGSAQRVRVPGLSRHTSRQPPGSLEQGSARST